jgi:hypothetical protein
MRWPEALSALWEEGVSTAESGGLLLSDLSGGDALARRVIHSTRWRLP